MLSQLYIENIAVIERVTIDFSNQLNVLTGETGAGKSILIDAINAIGTENLPRFNSYRGFFSCCERVIYGNFRRDRENAGISWI